MSEFNTVELQASYGVGRQLGEQLAANPFEGLDVTAVQQGLADALGRKPSAITQEELQNAFTVISERINAARQEQAKIAAEAGEKFLEENAKREEVIVTESGLQYQILEQGNGDKPTVDSTIRAHYEGRLPVSGEVFDSSIARGEPAEFPVSGVIAGWTEALQLMQVGAKYRLYIPHHLAYGEQGAGAAIPPFAALEFDVELIEIK
ncbi:FKBP-type peptidyl-prolyl cis-trans isomerase [Paraferrimonas sp. SM1919]|uniref:FKBP-type peptidyl-prolyl cis-trans isomerase n=1 Tax=Paraferrimonas sp. SM1919 TaxID=2662263 RepID=UPI0013D6F7EE|nr:FKBP-type peptidyl-prolyl cis-trans isomerase [Paraferrimonas sp. SM1919]